MDAKWQISCALVPLSYILLVAMLRHQRARRMPRRFGFIQDDYTKMTADQAQMILKELTELEFPTSMGFSIIFAVFKVQASPLFGWPTVN